MLCGMQANDGKRGWSIVNVIGVKAISNRSYGPDNVPIGRRIQWENYLSWCR